MKNHECDNSLNMLEKAILMKNPRMVIQSVAEGEILTDPAVGKYLEDKCFSDEVVFTVLLSGTPEKFLKYLAESAGKRVKKLAVEALAPLPQDPSIGEKALIRAIVCGDSRRILELVDKEKVFFQGFAPELLLMFPELTPEAVLAVLKDGLSAKLKAIVFGLLLKETEHADLLKSFYYWERVKYTNILLHLLAGESLSASEGFFPDHIHENFTYCFDPAHRFDPAHGRKVNIVWKEGERFRVKDHWEYKEGCSPLEKCIEITHDLSKAMELCIQWTSENFTEEEIGCVCTNNEYEAELEEE